MDNIEYRSEYDGASDAPSVSGSVLEPRPAGPASRFARHFHRPISAWAATTFLGWIVMASILIGLGLLLVSEFLQDGVGAWDRSVATWFVAQRTDALNSVTAVGSMMGSTFVVIGIAVVVGIVLAFRRHWLAIGFLAAALLIEVGAFLATAFVVSRPRPAVPQLDVAPPTSSFPSGHTAAALVLYASLAIIVWTLTDSRVLRFLFGALAVLVPIFVALSRLYRGMHHATDVLGSVVLGLGALVCAVIVTRVTTAATVTRVRQHAEASPETSTMEPGVSV
ncbi:MAG: phosphatase PAP2 family protein [Actinomycetota bacterium]